MFIAKTTKQDRVFTRRLLGTILTVYIPTLLLIIISHMTNYFKPFFFEAVVTVNLTVMLVLATMFISVSENLPKTSYIKMVDVWLIFNLMIPFFEVRKSKITCSKTMTKTRTKINIFLASKVIPHTLIDNRDKDKDNFMIKLFFFNLYF